MNIGSVQPTPNGELIGQLAIMSFDARIGLKPVASANERAPKFEVMALNVARRWVRIGALWEKEARESGEVYLAGHIDDPSLPAKLYVAAFRQRDGAYSVAWTRANPQAARGEAGPASAFEEESGPDAAPANDDAPPPRRRRARADATSSAEPSGDDDPFA